MNISDPIADFIIQIKNAGAAGKESITVPYSKVRMVVAELLKKEGYVENVGKHGRKTRKSIEVHIRYGKDGKPYIQDVKRISKPSRRVYFGVGDIRNVRQGHGELIVSTPEGVMTGKEARRRGVGGEALFEIW